MCNILPCREYRRIARERLAGGWGLAVLVTFVATLMGGTTTGKVSYSIKEDDVERIRRWFSADFLERMAPLLLSAATVLAVYSLIVFIVGGAVELGHNSYYIRRIRGEQPSFSELFSRFDIFAKALGQRLFMTLFTILWSFLFIIPGIIAAYRYALAPFLMAEHPEMGIRESVNLSKNLMQGYKGKLFLLELSFIGWAILCIFTLGIGNLWLGPYMSAARAAFYLERTGNLGGGYVPPRDDGPEFVYTGPERI